MESSAFRMDSLARLTKKGLSVPKTLPLLEQFSVRPASEIVDRIICMNALAAVAYGFDKERVHAWLSQERMLGHLTAHEHSLLDTGTGDVGHFKTQIEAMWALAWLVSLVPTLDFWRGCDSRFVTLLPDLKTAETSATFRAAVRLRSEVEIGPQVDLAYCLHWLLREGEIRGAQPTKGITPYVVLERRRALEWAIGRETWEEVSLDT